MPDKSTAAPAATTTAIRLMPHLTCHGAADAIEFYKNAFGAEEMMRLPAPDGRLLHAAITIGGHVVMLVDEFGNAGANATAAATSGTHPAITLHLHVPDVEAFYARAVSAGAKPVMPLADAFWGDRYGVVEDPFGHRWSLASTIKAMSLEELKAAAAAAMSSTR